MFFYGALPIVFWMSGIDQKVREVDWAFGNSLQLEGFRIHASPLAVVLHFRIPVNKCPGVLGPNIQGFFNEFVCPMCFYASRKFSFSSFGVISGISAIDSSCTYSEDEYAQQKPKVSEPFAKVLVFRGILPSTWKSYSLLLQVENWKSFCPVYLHD